MRSLHSFVLVCAVICAGCATAREQFAAKSKKKSSSPEVSSESFRAESGLAGWDWATGIPSNATNGDVIPASLSASVVAQLGPDFGLPELQLVSATNVPDRVAISNVNGLDVRTYSRLSAILENVARGDEPAKVRLDDGREAEVKPDNLIRLLHGTAHNVQRIRVTEDGNPWIITRSDGVRCKVFPRVERSRGLLQLVVTLQLLWGDQRVLPADVRVFCDSQPLEILSAAETLTLLYDRNSQQDGKRGDDAAEVVSFNDVASQESYVVPTNYKRLAAKFEEDTRMVFDPPQPALISVPGLRYPGPAILGDARALGGYLLTPSLYLPNAPAKTGWIMFRGDELKDGGHLRIEFNLGGSQPTVCEFDIPLTE